MIKRKILMKTTYHVLGLIVFFFFFSSFASPLSAIRDHSRFWFSSLSQSYVTIADFVLILCVLCLSCS
jgi:hypothetical protein